MSPTPRILVVDDRAQNLLALEVQLREERAELLKATSATEALELLLLHDVALAIVDVQMPVMDGFELAELMRGSPRTRNIPIIFVTAGLHDRTRVFQGYEVGAVDFLVKPIDPTVLKSKVAVFLQLYRQERELRDRVNELEIALVERRRAENQLAADHAALLRLHDLNARLLTHEALPELLRATVEAAVALTGADKGTLQLLDGASDQLGLVADYGFARPFLDCFASMRDGPATSREAIRRQCRCVVEDVRESELFRGTPMLEAMEAAQVRAVQSTLLSARRGNVLGVVSTYWSRPHSPSEITLRLLDLLARQAADLLEYRQREESLAEMNARLLEENRRKNAFLATLSHELRNPLAPITNSLHVLDHTVLGEERAARAKEVISRQVKQLASLIDDLLDVTRVTSNKINLQRRRVELNELIRRVVEDCRSLFDENQVELRLTPAPAALFVDVDSTRISQVVSNLLQNAAKFTVHGGYTRVHVVEETNEAVIRIEDNGVGMRAETVAGLFEPFMQAEQSLARSNGGLGLGLALVKGLVELHGGRVGAYSAGLGRGAEFTVRLPLATPASVESPSVLPGYGVPQCRRVLIIEDNVDAAESLREVLELGEHRVDVAHDGVEGLAKARLLRPEIVLCDIGLPGMDGYAVARAFRAEESLRSTRLVALSGYALPDDIERAIRAGFDDHLAKPPSLHKLEGLLASLDGGAREQADSAPDRATSHERTSEATPAAEGGPLR